MRCPHCGFTGTPSQPGKRGTPSSRVVWTWLNSTGRVRIRKHKCLACKQTWRSQERNETPESP